MKKIYIAIFVGIVLIIAYMDLIENCKEINHIKSTTYKQVRIGK